MKKYLLMAFIFIISIPIFIFTQAATPAIPAATSAATTEQTTSSPSATDPLELISQLPGMPVTSGTPPPRDAKGFPKPTAEQAQAAPSPASNPATPASPHMSVLNTIAAAKSGDSQAAAQLHMTPDQIGSMYPCINIVLTQNALNLLAKGLKELAQEIEKSRRTIKHAEKSVSKHIGKSKDELERELAAVKREIKKIEDDNKKHIVAAQDTLKHVKGSTSEIKNQINRCKGKSPHLDKTIDAYLASLQGITITQQDDALAQYITENKVPPQIAHLMREQLAKDTQNYLNAVGKKAELEQQNAEQDHVQLAQDLDTQLQGFSADVQKELKKIEKKSYEDQLNAIDEYIAKHNLDDQKATLESYIYQRYQLDQEEKDQKAAGKPSHSHHSHFGKLASAFKKAGKDLKKAANDVKKVADKASNDIDKGFKEFGECVGVAAVGVGYAGQQVTYNVANAALISAKQLQQTDPRLSALRAEIASIGAAIGAVETGKGVSIGAMEATRGILKAAEVIDKGLAEAIQKSFNLESIGVLIGVSQNSMTQKTEFGLPGFEITGIILGKKFHINTIIDFSDVTKACKSLWKGLRKVFAKR